MPPEPTAGELVRRAIERYESHSGNWIETVAILRQALAQIDGAGHGVLLVKHGKDCEFEKRIRGAVDVLSIEDCSVPRDDFERGERAGFAKCLYAIGEAMKGPHA